MSHFAKVDGSGVVIKLIVAERDFINSGMVGDEFLWVQTSYNNNFRKQFAKVGYTYDRVRDVFLAPKPHNSWELDNNNDWKAPVELTDNDNNYTWDEGLLTWVRIQNQSDWET
jgi:hypothetical protein